MKVALAQLSYIPGDIAGNSSRIIAALDDARAGGADLAVFSVDGRHRLPATLTCCSALTSLMQQQP